MQQNRIRRVAEQIAAWPGLYWVLLGFFLSYFLFFIVPIFLNPDHGMKFFQYVPSKDPIGQDLRYLLGYSASWDFGKGSPYIGLNLYPPLTNIIFSPLLLMDFNIAYKLVTVITLLAYILITFIIPMLISPRKEDMILPLVFLTTGLFSYFFQFELEKGQFNIIAFAFCALAIYLFHYQPKYRILAYILFIISIQLKIYPLIFIILFVDDWRDWKANFKRFAAVLVSNFLLFFVMGYQIFLQFVNAVRVNTLQPYIVMNNHSIKAFSELLFRKNGFRIYFLNSGMDLDQLHSIWDYSGLVQDILLVFVFICLFAIVFRMFKSGSLGFNPYLLTACTVAALTIPSVSNDYTISILGGPLVIALQKNISNGKSLSGSIASVFLLLIGSFAYSTMLYSYTNKPFFLHNNLLMLVIVLTVVTVMAMLKVEKPDDGLEPVAS